MMCGYQVLIEEILIVWLISCTQWRHSITKRASRKAAFLTMRKCINTFSVTDVPVRFRVSVLPCSFWHAVCQTGMWGPQRKRKKKNKMCVFYNIRENNPTLGLHHLQKKKRKKKPDTERVKYYYRNAWQQKECKLQNYMHKYAPTLRSRRWDEQDVRDSFVARNCVRSLLRGWAGFVLGQC